MTALAGPESSLLSELLIGEEVRIRMEEEDEVELVEEEIVLADEEEIEGVILRCSTFCCLCFAAELLVTVFLE